MSRWSSLCLLTCLGLLGCSEESDTDGLLDTEEASEVAEEDEDAESLAFEVNGIVTDSDGAPLEDAMVMVGGREDTLVYTDANGAFSLWYTDIGLGQPAIVGAKQGYRSIGFEFFDAETLVPLVLRKVNPPDNENYTYQDPGDGTELMKEDCSHCHGSFVSEFRASKHAEATKNPHLQDLYAGVSQAYTDEDSCALAGGNWALGHEPGTEEDSIFKCYLGGGVLPDLNASCGGEGQLPCDDPALDWQGVDRPENFGACADCHAPGIDGEAGGRDLHDAHGLAYDIGVHCDTCHKVKDVDFSLPPGVGNRLIMGRPGEEGKNTFEWDPVFYGPIIDVPNIVMGGSYQPKFNLSLFCSGCHEQNQEALLPGESLDETRWPTGLPVHTTYTEWQEGPYNQDATQCQFCHMPADMELNNAVIISTKENQSITFGFPREPEDIRKHTFRGPLHGSPRLIDQALYVSLSLESEGDELVATASLANIGCGHAIPTGEPMRSLLLLIEAEGECGELDPSGGLTIPDTGGAVAQGMVGAEISSSGSSLTWAEGADLARQGQGVRVVRPTGVFDDYTGVGAFADPLLSPHDKGMEIFEPVAETAVVAVAGDQLQLGKSLDLQSGDMVFLGDAWPDAPVDGQAALHLAGRPGYAFAKVLLDSEGERHVPHYRAVDMASDNRIPPGGNALTTHRFALPSGCDTGEVKATVLYRPIPLSMATLRGWSASDYIIATTSESWSF
jgi:hypothetical protein